MARILIIDDEPGMRQIITRVLTPHGHTVVTAEDGGQAIDICRNDAVDLALTDIRLPDMDAGEILAGLRKIRPHLPVIILSGFGDIDIAQGLVGQGATNYLTKPFKVNDLFHMVQNALQHPAEQDGAPAAPGTVAPSTEPPPLPPPVPVAEPAPLKPARPALKKKTILMIAAGVLSLAAVAAGIIMATGGQKGGAGTAYPIAQGNPSGLAWNGADVWVTDWVEGTVTAYSDKKTFTKRQAYTTTDVEPTGIAFQGNQLWISHGLGQRIYRYAIGDALAVTASFESPGPSPSGLFFDGIYLWSLDFQQAKVYKHSPANLSVMATYDSPAASPCSIFKNGKDLYIADASSNRIFKVNPDSFAIRGVYVIKGEENRKERLSAVMCDGKYLWICYDATSKIYRHRIQDLKSIKS